MQNSRTGMDVLVGVGGEAEQRGQVAVLEDPDHHAEGRAQGQRVADQRPDRLHDAAGEQEQQDEGGDDDDQPASQQVRADRVLGVDQAWPVTPPTQTVDPAGGGGRAGPAGPAAARRRRGAVAGVLLRLMRSAAVGERSSVTPTTPGSCG